ncbi:MAG: hypothetical protein QM844_16855 [Planctomycetota bacterium]|jgi:hypothetical protein|nr:hypothetical protein [Planctomycetota bacterium]
MVNRRIIAGRFLLSGDATIPLVPSLHESLEDFVARSEIAR